MKGLLQPILGMSLIAQVAACGSASTPEATAETTEAAIAAAQEIDWEAVDTAMGRSGAMQARGVYRFGMPRTDLSVTSQGVQIEPSLALGSWLAMKQSGVNEVVAMGDRSSQTRSSTGSLRDSSRAVSARQRSTSTCSRCPLQFGGRMCMPAATRWRSLGRFGRHSL